MTGKLESLLAAYAQAADDREVLAVLGLRACIVMWLAANVPASMLAEAEEEASGRWPPADGGDARPDTYDGVVGN